MSGLIVVLLVLGALGVAAALYLALTLWAIRDLSRREED